MKKRSSVLMFLLLAAALAFATSACKGEPASDSATEKEEGEEKAEGGAPAAASEVEAPKSVAVAAIGEVAPAAADLGSPGKVSFDQAVSAMGAGATNRIVFRVAPLTASGLVEMGLGTMPPEAKTEYDKFISESGFDPTTQIAGLLFFADGDIEKMESGNPAFIIGLNGAFSEQLLTYMDKMDEDDDDDDDAEKEDEMRLALLAELPTETQAKLVEFFERDAKEDSVVIEKKEFGTAVLLLKAEKGMAEYVYLWEGGVIVGKVLDNGKAPLEAIDAPLRALLGELSAAAKAAPSTSSNALEARVLADGKKIKATLSLDDTFTLDIAATLAGPELEQAKGLLAALPELKKDPAELLGEAPPPLHGLAKLVLAGTSASIEGEEFLGRVQVELSTLKKELEPALAMLK